MSCDFILKPHDLPLQRNAFRIEIIAPAVLCFMQNQWQPDADDWRAYWAEKRGQSHFYALRLRVIGNYIRNGKSMTARRLQSAFGDMIEDMAWENSTWQVGNRPSSKFPADLDHMNAVIEVVNPLVIVSFGSIARDGLLKMDLSGRRHVSFKHPTARGLESSEIATWRPMLEQYLEIQEKREEDE